MHFHINCNELISYNMKCDHISLCGIVENNMRYTVYSFCFMKTKDGWIQSCEN